jgi:hypothetical protein
MKYMSFVKGPVVPMDQIPPSLFEAMDVHIKSEASKGHFISGGGLWPSKDSFSMSIRGGKVVVVDGPFTETKEVIGGFAILSYATREEAIEGTRAFMALHQKHWPQWEGTSEMHVIQEA